MSSINTDISATTGANATAHNVRQVLQTLTRLFLAPTINSVSKDAAILLATENQIRKTIQFLGRDNETDTVKAIQCTHKFESNSWLTDAKVNAKANAKANAKRNSKRHAKRGRPFTRIDLRGYSIKALELARAKITSPMPSATLTFAS